MTYVIKNNSTSNLVFRGGYVNLMANSTTPVLDADVDSGMFQEYINRGILELGTTDEAPAKPVKSVEKIVEKTVEVVEDKTVEVVSEVETPKVEEEVSSTDATEAPKVKRGKKAE